MSVGILYFPVVLQSMALAGVHIPSTPAVQVQIRIIDCPLLSMVSSVLTSITFACLAGRRKARSNFTVGFTAGGASITSLSLMFSH